LNSSSYLLVSIVTSFVVTALLGRFFIPVLKSIKMGQKILDIGPRWHKSKEGTPTMGGLFFIGGFFAVILTLGIISTFTEGMELFIHVAFILFSGLIGFLDDYVKFIKKQNKGLNAKQKLLFQFASAAAYLVSLSIAGKLTTSVLIPFTSYRLELGILFYLFALVGIVFTVNSVNLTDGIDGLASSVTLIVAIFFSVLSYKTQNQGALLVSGAIIGGCLGFLVYNFHPARVFMGDTGSLFLGGFVSALAFWLDTPILLLFVGIIYYIESVSVIIQVISYKTTGKRVFKMTPIHHHFEMSGWGEVKIVFVFSAITAIFCTLGCYAFLGNI